MKNRDRVCTALLVTFGPSAAGLLTAEAQVSAVGITPRIAAYFDNSTQRETGVVNVVNSAPAIEEALRSSLGPTVSVTPLQSEITLRSGGQAYYPMYGGSFTFNLPGSDDTQITATAMIGEASTTSRLAYSESFQTDYDGLTSQDLFVTRVDTETDLERTDVEFTVQHRLDETFALLGGVRYERIEMDFVQQGLQTTTGNFSNLIAISAGVTDPFLLDLTLGGATLEGVGSTTFETFSARIGAAAYAQIGDNQRAYVNGLIQVSHAPASTADYAGTITVGTTIQSVTSASPITAETSIGPDLTVGYQFLFGERIALDLRYRGQFSYTVDGDADFNDPRVNHGVSLGLSVWF